MFCQYCGAQLASDAKFCPSCGKPAAHESAGMQQGVPSQQQYGTNPPQGQAKPSKRIGVIIAVIAAVVIVLVCLFAFGVFSPKPSGGSSAAAPGTAQSISQGSSAGGATANPGTSAASGGASSGGASSATSSPSGGADKPSSSPAPADPLQQAKDKAFDEGYQVFEGTVRVLSAEELAALQGADARITQGQEGTYVVLVFDAPIQVSAMSGDGSGMRRQGATMLGVAEQNKYITRGDVNSWKAYDGQHMTVAAKAEEMSFPSDVSLPVGEPSAAQAKILG